MCSAEVSPADTNFALSASIAAGSVVSGSSDIVIGICCSVAAGVVVRSFTLVGIDYKIPVESNCCKATKVFNNVVLSCSKWVVIEVSVTVEAGNFISAGRIIISNVGIVIGVMG